MAVERTRRAIRKKSVLEHIGNAIIWLSPLAIVLFVIFSNLEQVKQQPTTFKVTLTASFISAIIIFVYIKLLRNKLRDKMLKDSINEEKTKPFYRLCNSICAVAPFFFSYVIFVLFDSLVTPIQDILIMLLGCESLGHLILFVDSFRESKYE